MHMYCSYVWLVSVSSVYLFFIVSLLLLFFFNSCPLGTLAATWTTTLAH